MNLADVRAVLEDILDPRHFAPPTVKANARDCIAALDGLEDRMTTYIVEHGNRAELWAMALRAEQPTQTEKRCAHCQTPVVWRDEGYVYACPNPTCLQPAQPEGENEDTFEFGYKVGWQDAMTQEHPPEEPTQTEKED